MSYQRYKSQSKLGRVRGLGSAKSGVHHFLVERVTGLALVPLGLWFVYSLLATLLDGELSTLIAWTDSLAVVTLLLLLIIAAFMHSMSGVQVIIEDYIHKQPWNAALLLLNRTLHVVLALVCALSVLKLHLTPSLLP
jgi:succinate dehydrogenase / fumarate reductase, membrane anchor subunit